MRFKVESCKGQQSKRIEIFMKSYTAYLTKSGQEYTSKLLCSRTFPVTIIHMFRPGICFRFKRSYSLFRRGGGLGSPSVLGYLWIKTAPLAQVRKWAS